MIACVWVLPFDMKWFTLYPFVIHIDRTKCTNRENRILSIFTGRDSLGLQFIFLCALIPNECAWMFKWQFQNAFPILFGRENLNRVRIVITFYHVGRDAGTTKLTSAGMPPPNHQDIPLCASQSTLRKTHGTSHYKRN
jgi:hypothetical protein